MKTRFLNAVLALLVAWTAALLTTTPFQAAMCLRNSDGDMHLFRQMMPLVVMIWSAWTIGLALIGWVLVVLPLVLLVHPRWIRSHRGWLIAASAVFSLALTSYKFQIWNLLREDNQVDKYGFVLYTVFTMSYAVSMAAVYCWLGGRPVRQRFTDPALRN